MNATWANLVVEINESLHSCEILADELEFIGIDASELAKKIAVSKNRIYQIVIGECSITADTTLRLGKLFETEIEFGSSTKVYA